VSAKKAGLQKLVVVHKPAVTAHIVGLDNAPITTQIPLVSTDLNKFWSTEFANSGVSWPAVQDVLVSNTPAQSQACGITVNPTDPMQLCYDGTTATFYWTVPWMQQNIDTDPGGVNLSMGMSAAYSNAVLDLLGYFDQLKAGQITEAQWEQQNLCLTGIYARSLAARNLFEKADVPALQSFYNSLSGDSQGATAQQMQSAFAAGFNSGSPATCLPQNTTTTSTTTSATSSGFSTTSTAALPTSTTS
jgi:predicted metalloprotease